MSIETRKKFGATFSPKMGVRKCTNIWFDDNQVTPATRAKYPDLDNVMNQSRTQISLFDAKQALKEAKTSIKDSTVEAVNLASATLAGIFTLPAAKAAEVLAQIDVNLSLGLENQNKTDIHKAIDDIIPTYLD